MRKVAAILAALLLLSTVAYADSMEDYEEAIGESTGSLDDDLGEFSSGTLSNFSIKRTYDNRFEDINANAWYYTSVTKSYEYQLIDGTSSSTFTPDGNLTLGACIKIAACLNQVYYVGDVYLTNATNGNWYDSYVEYCEYMEILPQAYGDYNRVATRAEMAEIFAAALPAETLTPIKTVSDGAIPDIDMSSGYAEAVYSLYRAGILTGKDAHGSFCPDDSISRSEVATVLVRLVDKSLRIN